MLGADVTCYLKNNIPSLATHEIIDKERAYPPKNMELRGDGDCWVGREGDTLGGRERVSQRRLVSEEEKDKG